MPEIKCLLFDCDNTLVLSESLAFEACADLINELCQKQGVDKTFTGPQLIQEFVGQNFRGMLTNLQKLYPITLTPEELETYVEREMHAVIAKLMAKAQPCENVMPVLEEVYNSGKYDMAVVSSSAEPRVAASVIKVGQDKYFKRPDGTLKIWSAASSVKPPTSKPDPAVYNLAIKELGYEGNTDACVAIEDSKSGTTAGKRANLKVIGYVGPYEEEGPEKVEQMKKVLTDAGAIVIMESWTEFADCLKKIEAM